MRFEVSSSYDCSDIASPRVTTCSCQIPGWSRFVPKRIVKVPIFMLIVLRNSISYLTQSTTAHVDS